VAFGHRLWCVPRILPALVLAGCGHTPDLGPGIESGPPATLELISGDGQTGPVGDTLPVHLAVQVADSAGRPVAGALVTFAASAQGGSFVPREPRTDAKGRAEVRWVLGQRAGAAAATAGVSAVEPVSLSATALAGPPDASASAISAEPAALTAGDSAAIRVLAKDAFGNPVPRVAVHLSADGPGGTLTQPGVTDDEGLASGGFRAAGAGLTTVSAQVAGVPLARAVMLTVAPAPPVVTTVAVSPGDTAAPIGGTIQLTAVVRDANGDRMAGVPVVWSTSDATVATVAADGTMTGRGLGTATIKATADGHSGGAQLTVSFGEGALTAVTYCTIDGVADLMDVYEPRNSAPRPLPVAIQVHGGGWVSGARSTGDWFTRIEQELLERGYLVVSLDYRLAPAHKYPSQIEDVKCAVRHLRARAARYGLAPSRIGVWGGSAGGQLTALLGTADESAGFDAAGGFQGVSSRVQAVMTMSAITDFTHPDELNDDYSREFLTWPQPDSPEMIEASPAQHVTDDDAPFFLLVGDDDALVESAQSVRLDSSLRAAGVESSLLRVAHADHDLAPTTAPIDPDAATIVQRVANFFDRHLR
jgi:acetyl esterase/lipase